MGSSTSNMAHKKQQKLDDTHTGSEPSKADIATSPVPLKQYDTNSKSKCFELFVYSYINTVEKECKLFMTVADGIKETIFQFYATQIIVIKNGSDNLRIGFGADNDNMPKYTLPSIVGVPRHPGVMIGLDNKDCYIAQEATQKRGILSLKYPIERGIITDWDKMQKLWNESFKLLNTEDEYNDAKCNVLLTEKANNSKANRERMAQIMFEQFNVDGIVIVVDAVLSLYATNRTTGCVINSGKEVTHIVPIHDGIVLNDNVSVLDIGGKNIIEYFARLTESRGYSFATASEMEIAKDLVKKCMYVCKDIDAEYDKCALSTEIQKNYQLPDGQIITIDISRFKSTEPLFQPNYIGLDTKGIHELLFDSIMKCDEYLRPNMCNNILLSGGNMKYDGMKDRLEYELLNIAQEGTKINIINVEDKELLSFVGGSILSSTTLFQKLLITKEEYNDIGGKIVHNRQQCKWS